MCMVQLLKSLVLALRASVRSLLRVSVASMIVVKALVLLNRCEVRTMFVMSVPHAWPWKGRTPCPSPFAIRVSCVVSEQVLQRWKALTYHVLQNMTRPNPGGAEDEGEGQGRAAGGLARNNSGPEKSFGGVQPAADERHCREQPSAGADRDRDDGGLYAHAEGRGRSRPDQEMPNGPTSNAPQPPPQEGDWCRLLAEAGGWNRSYEEWVPTGGGCSCG